MNEIPGIYKSLGVKLMSFLSEKPIWVFWIVFIVLSGLLFGIFYTVMYLMAFRWWIAAVTIIAIGIIWGSITYKRKPDKEKKEV